MIPLAELPTTDGVYVIHFSAPMAHAHEYVGWSADIARRMAEHLDFEACRRAGFHVASQRGSATGPAPPSAPAVPFRSPRSTPAAIAASNGGCTTGITRASARCAALNDHRARGNTGSRSHVASPPLLIEGRASSRSGGFAMTEAERQARFREKRRVLASEPERLPSGNSTDVCHDCGTRIVATTPDDVDRARCACPPQRFEYLVELVCSLCSREIAAVRVPTPRSRVVLLRPVRCQICGGQALASGEVARVLVATPLTLHPRCGRPPRGLRGVAA